MTKTLMTSFDEPNPLLQTEIILEEKRYAVRQIDQIKDVGNIEHTARHFHYLCPAPHILNLTEIYQRMSAVSACSNTLFIVTQQNTTYQECML